MPALRRRLSSRLGLTRPAVRLDESHPLFEDLAFCFVPWGRGMLDLVTGSHFLPISGGYNELDSDFGAKYVDQNSNRVDTGTQYLTGNTVTLLSVARVKQGATQTTLLCQRRNNGNDQFELRANSVGGINSISFLAYDEGTNGHASTASDASLSGVPDSFNWRWFAGSANSGGGCQIYVDGVSRRDTFASHAMSMGPSSFLTLGGLPGTATIAFADDKMFDMGWNAAMEAELMEELRGDSPLFWSLFDAPMRLHSIPAAAGGPATHTITPSGGITFAGSGVYQYARTHDVSGGVQLAGSAALKATRIHDVSGGVQFAGTSTFNVSRDIVPDGGVQLGGSATQTNVRVHDVSGGLSFSGAAGMQATRVLSPSGGLSLGGTGNFTGVEAGLTIVPSGGIQFGGGASGTLWPDNLAYGGFAHRVARKVADDVADDVTDFHRRYDD